MIPNELLALYTGVIKENNGQYFVSIPSREIESGQLTVGQSVQIAAVEAGTPSRGGSQPTKRRSQTSRHNGSADRSQATEEPPVEEGDIVEVEISDVGEKGDGIARVAGGYVLVVEGGDVGDTVEVEITNTHENYAFAEVVQDGQVADA